MGDKRVEANPSDYSKPMGVDWLCKEHHVLFGRDNIPHKKSAE